MSTGLKANPDGSAAIQVGGTDVITLTSGGAATFVTSPTTVQAGTAAAPSITTSGDTNTGIFFPAADTIAFTEGGAEVARFDSAGNFGLGLSPNTSQGRLQIVNFSIAGGAPATSDTTDVNQLTTFGMGSTQLRFGAYASGAAWIQQSANSSYATNYNLVLQPNGGNVGIGTSSPNARLSLGTNVGTVGQPNQLVLYDDATLANRIGFGISSGLLNIVAGTSTSIAFYTNGANERARITSGGYFKTANDGAYNDVNGNYCEFLNTNNNQVMRLVASNASYTSIGVQLIVARNTTNNTFYAIEYYNSGASAAKFRVADSGNVTNTNGSYGTTSDVKLKQDIVDASSQWSDIKSLRFRKYRWKSEVADNPDAPAYLGLIAQEAKEISPGLVEEHIDRDAEGNDLGTTTKSVKTSILYMKAVKALQEAMTRIEALEAEVQALKGAA